jgi:hypothetical protein
MRHPWLFAAVMFLWGFLCGAVLTALVFVYR